MQHSDLPPQRLGECARSGTVFAVRGAGPGEDATATPAEQAEQADEPAQTETDGSAQDARHDHRHRLAHQARGGRGPGAGDGHHRRADQEGRLHHRLRGAQLADRGHRQRAERLRLGPELGQRQSAQPAQPRPRPQPAADQRPPRRRLSAALPRQEQLRQLQQHPHRHRRAHRGAHQRRLGDLRFRRGRRRGQHHPEEGHRRRHPACALRHHHRRRARGTRRLLVRRQERRGLERELHMQYFDREPLWSHDRPWMDSEFDSPRRNWGYGGVQQGVATNLRKCGIRLFDVPTITRIRPPDGACEQFGGDFFTHNRISTTISTARQTDTGWQCANAAAFEHWTLRNGSEDLSVYLYGTKQFGNVEAWATYGYWDSTGESNTFMPAWGSSQLHRPRQRPGAQPVALLRAERNRRRRPRADPVQRNQLGLQHRPAWHGLQ